MDKQCLNRYQPV